MSESTSLRYINELKETLNTDNVLDNDNNNVLIDVHSVGGKWLVWEPSAIFHLRKTHRIVGTLIGTHSQFQQQNLFCGVPLLLSDEEVFLLSKRDLVRLISNNGEPVRFLSKDRAVKERSVFTVFEDLWMRGYFISNGSKFGGNFLVYPGDPLLFHAHFIVIVVEPCEIISPLDIVSYGRLGVSVKKMSVLASVDPHDSKVYYFPIDWQGVT